MHKRYIMSKLRGESSITDIPLTVTTGNGTSTASPTAPHANFAQWSTTDANNNSPNSTDICNPATCDTDPPLYHNLKVA